MMIILIKMLLLYKNMLITIDYINNTTKINSNQEKNNSNLIRH